MVCPSVSGGAEALAIAEVLPAALAGPVPLHGDVVPLRGSAGVAYGVAVHPDVLVDRADLAM